MNRVVSTSRSTHSILQSLTHHARRPAVIVTAATSTVAGVLATSAILSRQAEPSSTSTSGYSFLDRVNFFSTSSNSSGGDSPSSMSFFSFFDRPSKGGGQPNLRFYRNEIPSVPNGDYIDNIHMKWFGQYHKLVCSI